MDPVTHVVEKTLLFSVVTLYMALQLDDQRADYWNNRNSTMNVTTGCWLLQIRTNSSKNLIQIWNNWIYAEVIKLNNIPFFAGDDYKEDQMTLVLIMIIVCLIWNILLPQL